MDWLFNPDIRATSQEQFASRNLIMQNFQSAFPNGRMTFWMRTEEPYLCDILYKEENGKRSYVFANPYTGEIQGEAFLTFQRFFRDLHYFLFIPFQIGHFTVLLFAFLLFTSLITALVFYKKWWKKLFQLQVGKGSLFFFRSLHRLVGLWSIPFTLLFSITGIWYFLERANIAEVATRSNPPVPKIQLNGALVATYNTNTIDYDRVAALAEEAIPSLKAGDIVPSRGESGPIYITGHSNVPLVRQRANRVYIHPESYEVIDVQKASDIPAVMYLNDIADPLHFGNWGGLPTKILWFLFGLAISSLVLSGIWITAKKKALKRKKNKKKLMGSWYWMNWLIYSVMILFMYYIIIENYHASHTAIIAVTAGWTSFIAMAYYLFVYKLKKAIS
ncbi:PepSY-associated TM helix [Croceitalea dokdonensis DOKDO 023]|uniref:PepSY-associated TM helix n=2 Tax=Croceitalea TaxID=574891 RepID=A0A0P7AIN0_9FLAO|nr:PepSY-associated TM helix [Croceitalea dokdonensis DOKDO 023]